MGGIEGMRIQGFRRWDSGVEGVGNGGGGDKNVG